jgi:serine/threonine protein kinase
MNQESIFAAALEKGDPAERAAFLDEACAGDPGLRRRVEALLQSHDEAGSFLEQPALAQPAGTAKEEEGDAGATRTGVPGGGGDELALDFLSPPQRPGGLGRLGHYEILEVVGRGGMGVVLKAFDEALQRVVAIKVMAPQLAATASARKRFTREAQAAAAVRDEHVVDIHAVEEVDGLPYLVMEYIDGVSLQERLDRDGPLELKEVLRIGMQTAAGLAAAHAQGLIHRDVKPANILLENGVQRVKITDFGLARAVDDASLTQSGVIAGTPQYMAPEQARGEVVDPRADLFSLGSVLYAMCTGRPPFRARSVMAVLKRVCEDTPRPPREINPDVPDWLCAIIGKAHAKDPTQRFQSAQEVADLLGQHLLHLQQPGAAPLPPPVERPAPPRTKERSRALPWVLLAAGVAGLGCCALSVPVLLTFGWVTTWSEESRPPSPVSVEAAAPGGEGAVLRPGPPVPDAVLEPGQGVPAVRARATLAGHVLTAPTVAFSPDGKTLATADRAGKVYIWDAATGEKLASFQAHGGTIWSLAYSPDGKLLASASWDHTAKVWDAATRELRTTLQGHTDRLWWVGFAPDGKTLATASEDTTARIWDATQGNEQRLLEHGAPVYCAVFRPDGKLLATSTASGLIRLWDTPTWQCRTRLEGHASGVRLAFSPDGQTLASGSQDWTVGLWDVSKGRKVASLTGFQEPLEGVAFSPDGKLLATAGGNWRDLKVPGEVTIWDVAARRRLARVVGHASCVHAVALSPDGKTLASASDDRTVKLWDLSRFTPSGAGAAKPAVAQPFVHLARGDKAERTFATLAEAAAAAADGDTIEVRGDGPFASQPIHVAAGKALTIRAGEGFRPVINLQPKESNAEDPLVEKDAPLVLEGLTLQRLPPWQGGRGHPERNALLLAWKVPIRVANCRFLTKAPCVGIWASESPVCDLRNCEFGGPDLHAAVDWTSPPGGILSLENCLLLAGPHGLVIHQKSADGKGRSVRLTHNTLSAYVLLEYWLWAPVQDALAHAKDESGRSLRIEANANLFDTPGHVLDFKQIDQPKPLAAQEAETALPRLVSWRERRNIYPARPHRLLLLSSAGSGEVLRSPASPSGVATTAEWGRYWGEEQNDAAHGIVRYQGGDVRARATSNPEQIRATDFRLENPTAGKGEGEGGRDLGADVDLVGPGAAYGRWKQTPEYRQWLKDAGEGEGGS